MTELVVIGLGLLVMFAYLYCNYDRDIRGLQARLLECQEYACDTVNKFRLAESAEPQGQPDVVKCAGHDTEQAMSTTVLQTQAISATAQDETESVSLPAKRERQLQVTQSFELSVEPQTTAQSQHTFRLASSEVGREILSYTEKQQQLKLKRVKAQLKKRLEKKAKDYVAERDAKIEKALAKAKGDEQGAVPDLARKQSCTIPTGGIGEKPSSAAPKSDTTKSGKTAEDILGGADIKGSSLFGAPPAAATQASNLFGKGPASSSTDNATKQAESQPASTSLFEAPKSTTGSTTLFPNQSPEQKATSISSDVEKPADGQQAVFFASKVSQEVVGEAKTIEKVPPTDQVNPPFQPAQMKMEDKPSESTQSSGGFPTNPVKTGVAEGFRTFETAKTGAAGFPAVPAQTGGTGFQSGPPQSGSTGFPAEAQKTTASGFGIEAPKTAAATGFPAAPQTSGATGLPTNSPKSEAPCFPVDPAKVGATGFPTDPPPPGTAGTGFPTNSPKAGAVGFPTNPPKAGASGFPTNPSKIGVAGFPADPPQTAGAGFPTDPPKTAGAGFSTDPPKTAGAGFPTDPPKTAAAGFPTDSAIAGAGFPTEPPKTGAAGFLVSSGVSGFPSTPQSSGASGFPADLTKSSSSGFPSGATNTGFPASTSKSVPTAGFPTDTESPNTAGTGFPVTSQSNPPNVFGTPQAGASGTPKINLFAPVSSGTSDLFKPKPPDTASGSTTLFPSSS